MYRIMYEKGNNMGFGYKSGDVELKINNKTGYINDLSYDLDIFIWTQNRAGYWERNMYNISDNLELIAARDAAIFYKNYVDTLIKQDLENEKYTEAVIMQREKLLNVSSKDVLKAAEKDAEFLIIRNE